MYSSVYIQLFKQVLFYCKKLRNFCMPCLLAGVSGKLMFCV